MNRVNRQPQIISWSQGEAAGEMRPLGLSPSMRTRCVLHLSQYTGHQPNGKVRQGSSLCQLRAQTAAYSHYWRDPELEGKGSRLARVVSNYFSGQSEKDYAHSFCPHSFPFPHGSHQNSSPRGHELRREVGKEGSLNIKGA